MTDRSDDQYDLRADARYGGRRRTGMLLPLVLGLLLLVVVGGLGWGIWSGAISLSGDVFGPRTATAAVAQPTSTTPADPQAAAAPAAATTSVPTREQAFDDWLLTCVAGEGGADNCTLMQRLADSKSGNPLFVWRIGKNDAGGLVASWQTPEVVLLTRGVYLDIGTPQPLIIPYERCGGGSCLAVATLAPDLVQTLNTAEKITVGYVLTDGRQMAYPMSPKGLAAGLAELSK